MATTRLVAIEGGGDWSDASVDYLQVPEGVDLARAHAEHNDWYNQTFVPARRRGESLPYLDFVAFLLERCAATRAADSDIEVFSHG